MLNGVEIWGFRWPRQNWDSQVSKMIHCDASRMRPCIIMHVNQIWLINKEWHNLGVDSLVNVIHCIYITIEMHQISFCIHSHTSPNTHTPTPINIPLYNTVPALPLIASPPYSNPSITSLQTKPRFIWKNNSPPIIPGPSCVRPCPCHPRQPMTVHQHQSHGRPVSPQARGVQAAPHRPTRNATEAWDGGSSEDGVNKTLIMQVCN